MRDINHIITFTLNRIFVNMFGWLYCLFLSRIDVYFKKPHT